MYPQESCCNCFAVLRFNISFKMPSYTHPPDVNSGTTTIWLPVTTTHPQNGECISGSPTGTNELDVYTWPPTFLRPQENDLSSSVKCLPRAVTLSVMSAYLVDNQVSTVYSLGPFTCPAAYTTASDTMIGTSRSILCCPRSA